MIIIKLNDIQLKNLDVAKNNIYYIVLANFGKAVEDDSLITNQLQAGMSYLVTIDTTKIDIYKC